MELTISNYKIYSVVLDLFRLDGGAMFGSVPKPLWEKDFPADEKNRIQLCARALILEGNGRKILLDAGCGPLWTEKEKSIFHIESSYSESLAKLLLDITDVVLTHLHFDHAGGISTKLSDKIVPTFPHARHWVSRENLERAKAPGIRERVSYRGAELEVLNQVDLKLFESGEEIMPGIVMNNLYGHTFGMSWLGVRENAKYGLIFMADLCPTASHVRIPYVMGYDLLAEITMREKNEVFALAYADSALLVFEHDPKVSSGYLGLDEKGNYILKEQCMLDRGL